MLTSETITKVSAALVKAQAELEHVAKDKNNPHFKSKYADLASVVDAIRPVYAANGLAVVQGFVPDESGVTIETRIIHTSGEWIADEGLHLPIDKNNAQGVGSAITYGRRYTLLAMSGVAPDDDDDGNAAARPVEKSARTRNAIAAGGVPATKPAVTRSKGGTPMHPAGEPVNEEQAKELAAAAVAAGHDPKLAERRASLTKAVDFHSALKKLKDATANA